MRLKELQQCGCLRIRGRISKKIITYEFMCNTNAEAIKLNEQLVLMQGFEKWNFTVEGNFIIGCNGNRNAK